MTKTDNTDGGNLAETLNAILADLHEAAKTGAELAGKELSLLAEEVVMYGAIVSIGWIVASLFLLGVAWKFYSVAKELFQEREKIREIISAEKASPRHRVELSDVDSNICAVYAGVVVFTFTGGVMLLMNGVGLCKVILAPRLFLLEYTAALIK